MIDETDPAIRATRARFAQIQADLGDRFDATRAAYQAKLAEHERFAAERAAAEQAAREQPPAPPPPQPTRPRRAPRPEPEDPSDTGVFSVSWMTKR